MIFGFVRLFFFFKQKTAYEMRISDWSSDVCSSDLLDLIPVRERRSARRHERCRCRQAGAERFEALRLQRVEATLGNQIRALPVVAAIDQHQHAADRKSTRLNSSH